MSSKTQWGATHEEWMHFATALGLVSDLLPVVSNPSARISSGSKMKALGKTPSIYNKSHTAAGIPDWTNYRATPEDILKWSAEPDYGVCIQTRHVRALDVDVDDADKAMSIGQAVLDALGFELPHRFRNGSSKFLFAFILDGDCPKRIMPVDGGIIEFLGDGQQFVAAGTHTSKVKYEWFGGLPGVMPVLTREQFELVWDILELNFATGEVSIARPRLVSGGSGNDVALSNGSGTGGGVGTGVCHLPQDEVVEFLDITGLALGKGRAGEVYLSCPFKNEHTSDSGITETVYFPASTGGYEMGHFKCLHAHCMNRSDGEFKDALGIGFATVIDGFDDLGPDLDIIDGVVNGVMYGKLETDLMVNDEGRVLANLSNLQQVLTRPELCGMDIRYDTFRGEMVYKTLGEHTGQAGSSGAGSGLDAWQSFGDTDYTELRYNLETTGFNPISHEMISRVVHWVAKKRMFDTAIEWLNTLSWDGVPRVSKFMARCMSAEDDSYNSAVSDYMWAAMAGRVLEPGCKADAAIIFIGKQLIGKTKAIMSLVPDIRQYCEINFEDKDDDLARKIRGKMVAEFAEMRGFQGRESESTKAYISRQFEEWTPKYMEFVTVYPRRLLFFGSSNTDEFLGDETGNRREFPIRVNSADINYIESNRDQMWAEGAEMFRRVGIEKYYRVANNLADDIRAEFMITDAWDDDVRRILHAKNPDGGSLIGKEYFTIVEVARELTGLDVKNYTNFHINRIGKILRKYGCEKTSRRINGVVTKVWSVKN